MDYYQTSRDLIVQKSMYPTEFRRDFFPKSICIENLKINPKSPNEPRFVSKIEGSAVEEGAKVFFEGIVSAQPQPLFTWFVF